MKKPEIMIILITLGVCLFVISMGFSPRVIIYLAMFSGILGIILMIFNYYLGKTADESKGIR